MNLARAAGCASLALLVAMACSDGNSPSSGRSEGTGGRSDAGGAPTDASTGGNAGVATSSGGNGGSAGTNTGASGAVGAVPDASPRDADASPTPHDGGGLDASGADGSSDTVGPSGGAVAGPDGALATVPQGALTSSVTFAITENATDAPSLPVGMLALGPVYAFTPHGTEFGKPVTVRVPFDAASVPSDVTPVLLQAEPGGAFTQIPAQIDGATMTATVSSFSWFVAARDGTQGTLLVTIGGPADSLGRTGARSQFVRTGPAGSVYVIGSAYDVLDDTYTGTRDDNCFVAKLTTTLGFEWVHQYDGSCGSSVPSVGPTGNVYFVLDALIPPGTTPTGPPDQYLVSVNPSGATRAGFPALLTSGLFGLSVVVDSQDDPTLVGMQQVGATPELSRVVVGTFNSSGGVKQAIAQLSFGAPVGNDYTTEPAAAINGAGFFISGGLVDSSDTSAGIFLQRFDASGSVAPGFPIVYPKSGLGPGQLVTLPGTSDLFSFGGTMNFSTNTTDYDLLRYHEDGTLAAGFPHALDVGSNRILESWTQFVSDSQGNVYFAAVLNLPYGSSSAQGPESVQQVLSYTSAGALRAGYPMPVGYQEASDSNPSTIADMGVDGAGTLYFTGYYTDPKTQRNYIAIERLPAR